MSKLIGIFGGTFDPVHLGHIKPALEVKQALALDQLRFLPNRVLPDREPPMFSAQQRLQLLELATAAMADVVVDTRELDRDTPSFMVDTLISLRADFPDDHLCLILGMDAFSGLYQWHQWQKILDLTHIIVTTRPGFSWPLTAEMKVIENHKVEDVSGLKAANTGGILLQSVTQLDISSSYIRQQLRQQHGQGSDINNLMPEGVGEKLFEMMQDK